MSEASIVVSWKQLLRNIEQLHEIQAADMVPQIQALNYLILECQELPQVADMNDCWV